MVFEKGDHASPRGRTPKFLEPLKPMRARIDGELDKIQHVHPNRQRGDP
jgi:hypothetical protein